MIVRDFTEQDSEQVIELSKQLARHVEDPVPHLSRDTIAALTTAKTRWFEALVVEDAGRLLGLAAFVQSFEFHTNSRLLLVTDLAVDLASRRSGIGQVLLDALQGVASERRCRALKLEVWVKNEQALAFYARNGAQEIDEVKILSIPV